MKPAQDEFASPPNRHQRYPRNTTSKGRRDPGHVADTERGAERFDREVDAGENRSDLSARNAYSRTRTCSCGTTLPCSPHPSPANRGPSWWSTNCRRLAGTLSFSCRLWQKHTHFDTALYLNVICHAVRGSKLLGQELRSDVIKTRSAERRIDVLIHEVIFKQACVIILEIIKTLRFKNQHGRFILMLIRGNGVGTGLPNAKHGCSSHSMIKRT